MRAWWSLTGTGVGRSDGARGPFGRCKMSTNRFQNLRRAPSGHTPPRVAAHPKLGFSCSSQKNVFFKFVCLARTPKEFGPIWALKSPSLAHPLCVASVEDFYFTCVQKFSICFFLRSCVAAILIKELGRSKGLSRRDFLRTLHGHFGEERRR